MPQGTWKTTGGSSGGAGSAALAIGVAVAVVALAGPVVAAVASLVKALVTVLAAVLVVAAVAGAVVWRLRSRRPVRELPVRRALPQVQARVLPAQAQPAAIENHFHFHGMTADDVAQAIARRQEQP